MPREELSDTKVRSIKAPPPGQRLEFSDSKCQGLNLRVTDKRVMTWSFMWRDKTSAATKRITLGRYPDVSLRDARLLCDQHRGATATEGSNPQAEKQAKREAARNYTTFGTVADAYIERYAKTNKLSWQNDVIYLKPVRAAWENLNVAIIAPADAKALLRSIARSAPVSANRTQSVLHKLFAWAADEFGLTVNPMAGMARQGGKETPKDRNLDAREVKALWSALGSEDAPMAPTIRLALKLILLTACRPGEVAGMMTTELHGLDTAEPEWRIPGNRTKNGRPHVVPLSAAAVSVILEALALSPLKGARPVLFSKFDPSQSIARHSTSQATARFTVTGVERFTPHDLRRSAATLARRAGVRRDTVKALLNHSEGDVTEVYDTYDLLPERRAALELVAAVVA